MSDSIQWAVYDTVEHCWLGNNDTNTGPRTFATKQIATLSENIIRESLGYPAGRLAVVEYHDEATRKRDELPWLRDPKDVLDELSGDRPRRTGYLRRMK